MDAGFYKVVDNNIVFSATRIISSDGVFNVADHETYQYPIVGGWYYFANYEEAELYFNAELKKIEDLVKIDGIPQTVTKARALIALDNMGKLEQLNAIIERPETPNSLKIAFQHESHISRNSPLVNQLGQGLGMSKTELDNLFIQANSIIL